MAFVGIVRNAFYVKINKTSILVELAPAGARDIPSTITSPILRNPFDARIMASPHSNGKRGMRAISPWHNFFSHMSARRIRYSAETRHSSIVCFARPLFDRLRENKDKGVDEKVDEDELIVTIFGGVRRIHQRCLGGSLPESQMGQYAVSLGTS